MQKVFILEDNTKKDLYQWDTNQRFIVNDPTVIQAHFCVSLKESPLTCEVYEEKGTRFVNIPNILLQKAQNFRVYAYRENETVSAYQFNIIARPQPTDYIYEETNLITVEGLVEEAILEAKEKGTFDGRDGVDGKDGRDGRDGIDGKDGRDGIDGINGTNGVDGKDGNTPYIQNGFWYINGENTGVKARADYGETFTASISGKQAKLEQAKVLLSDVDLSKLFPIEEDDYLVKWNGSTKQLDKVGAKILPEKLQDGCVVVWKASENRFAGGGYPPVPGSATPHTIAVRNGSGAIRTGYQTGQLDLATNIRTVEEAMSCNYINFFTSNKNSYTYTEGRFAGIGWSFNDDVWGYLTDVPTTENSKWFQKVLNGSPYSNTLTITNCLQFSSSYNTVEKLLWLFTDKVDSYKVVNGTDLQLTIKPNSNIYIQCWYNNGTQKYSRIYIT